MTTNIATLHSVSKRFKVFNEKTLKERFLSAARSGPRGQDFWALKDVSLDIPLGSTLGLVGHNGSGKSTLLKLLGGIFQPTAGDIFRRGRLAALLELGAGFHPDLTGRENVFLISSLMGMNKKETERNLDGIIAFSGIEQFIDTPVKFYSSGMYVRLAFAASIFSDPDLLIVDEVLAVGDEPFQAKCLAKIREFQIEGRSIVLVTHATTKVAEFCDEVAVLDKGTLRFVGNTRSGLKLLADIYAESSAPESFGRAEALIQRVSIRPSRVDALGEIPLGASLTLDVELHLSGTITAPSAQVTFTSSTGQLAYQLSSQDLSLEFPSAAGTYSLSFNLADQHLGGGEYHVSVEVFDGAHKSVVRRDRAASFFISAAPFGLGTARFDVTGSIAPLSESGPQSV